MKKQVIVLWFSGGAPAFKIVKRGKMMETVLLLTFAIPISGAFLLPLVGRYSTRLRNVLAFLLVAASLTASAVLVGPVLSKTVVSFAIPLSFPGFEILKGFDPVFSADALGVFMALVSSLVSLIIVFYSFGYVKHDENQNEYYLMVVLFLGSMVGLVYSQNLLYIYLFWEIAAIVCWRLIGFYREREFVLRADKAFLITVGGALAMLLGFIILFNQYGSFDLRVLHGKAVPDLALVLIIIGIFSKSATLPFHTWLPDAGVAPSPVTALLHAAVLVKIGVFAFARIFVASGLTFAPDWHLVLLVVISTSALVSAGAALIDTDLKRIIAYSTISQLAFIFLGLMIDNKIALTGGLLFILMHALGKGGLFLCAGIIEHTAHTKDLRRMGGLIKTMPVTAAAFGLCSLSLMGIPPFGGFFAKYLIIGGTIASNIWVATVFVVGSFMTALYLIRAFMMAFLGDTQAETKPEGSPTMVWSVAILAGLSLLAGFLVQYPNELIQIAIGQITGR
jgi:NADH:ubiquinone oxidoreductase subunit 5 (subunit L)/multisubunit Na+/H+ antiporter MnhA subunit